MTLIRFLRTLAALAADNLRASRGQAVYLIITLAITTAAWLTLAAIASAGGVANGGFGITMRNGSQSSGALPLSYARRIQAIRGARDVAWIGYQGVNCTSATTVALYAFGGPGTVARLRKQKVPDAVRQRWLADPLGAVVSSAAIAKCGWQVGQGIDPPMLSNHEPIELHVIGSYPGNGPSALVHFNYQNRMGTLEGKDKVVNYFARASDPRADELLAARIEAAFAHDFPAVNATTNATVQNAWARYGKVQQLLAFVMAAILLCAASVLVSVLAHAAAQRKSKFALLQVLGFRRATLFGALTLELLATVVAGALLGLGLARLAAGLGPDILGVLSGYVHVPAWAWWGLPVWLAVLIAAALAWPAGLIARVRPADYRAI
ncbi:MAG TPA: FtsX-like permease family protein [Rhodanobacteraceae bacterium]|nr:FtsX-like permease family protein [Rhodanobacteraceae bacterium]